MPSHAGFSERLACVQQLVPDWAGWSVDIELVAEFSGIAVRATDSITTRTIVDSLSELLNCGNPTTATIARATGLQGSRDLWGRSETDSQKPPGCAQSATVISRWTLHNKITALANR